eukprot:TRINITY_DN26775_c0_g2_i1.p1 TRINITY_DN26775_c0_g2~~TRINITY_DN26775_c0_g2_i1.p1  ORF type:complete len:357 (-),score=36.32 TRINITY_DN26775_c0_g2_i1:90-1160(-)
MDRCSTEGSGRFPPKLTSLEQCESSLRNKLSQLKQEGVLKHSLLPLDKQSDFEILEFYGDSVLSERCAYFMLQTRRFMNPHLLSSLRTECIKNDNLAAIFDRLQLAELPMASTARPHEPYEPPLKGKADVVEAMIGELRDCMDKAEFMPLVARIKGVLTEMICFIAYVGEQTYFQLQQRADAKRLSLVPPLSAAAVDAQPLHAGLLPVDPPEYGSRLNSARRNDGRGRRNQSRYQYHLGADNRYARSNFHPESVAAPLPHTAAAAPPLSGSVGSASAPTAVWRPTLPHVPRQSSPARVQKPSTSPASCVTPGSDSAPTFCPDFSPEATAEGPPDADEPTLDWDEVVRLANEQLAAT